LDIAAVPEPGSMVEGAVAVLFLGGVIGLYRLKGAKAQPRPVAHDSRRRPALWVHVSAWRRAVTQWLDAV
jgi:hypothetical protein